MFERFTEGAKQAGVVLPQEEARALKHNYIGTEHILLGLLREEKGLAAQVLQSLGVTVEGVRAQLVRIVGSIEQVNSGQIPFTPRAKKVLDLALREALALGHNYIGTEHILLGLMRENEGVAARILLDLGADSEKIRNEVIKALGGTEVDESNVLRNFSFSNLACMSRAELERIIEARRKRSRADTVYADTVQRILDDRSDDE